MTRITETIIVKIGAVGTAKEGEGIAEFTWDDDQPQANNEASVTAAFNYAATRAMTQFTPAWVESLQKRAEEEGSTR